MMQIDRAASAGGLRERKKIATKQAIEHAALDLSLAHGYENVTVEMICEVAGISQRTFFNYVGSKEGAVLGDGLPDIPDELRDGFVNGHGGVLEDLVELLATIVAASGGAQGDLLLRRQLFQESPQLALKGLARMEEAEASVLALVRERLRHEARNDPSEDDDIAKMVVSLTFGILHYVARAWMAAGFPDDIREVLSRAVNLAQRVAGQPD